MTLILPGTHTLDTPEWVFHIKRFTDNIALAYKSQKPPEARLEPMENGMKKNTSSTLLQSRIGKQNLAVAFEVFTGPVAKPCPCAVIRIINKVGYRQPIF